MIKAGQLLQKNSYAAQLQTEEWESFASSVRKGRGNFCEMCRQGNVQTQVHHIFYDPNKKLWEYEDEDLMVLCIPCHKAFHAAMNGFRKNVVKFMRPEHLERLNMALREGLTRNDPLEFVHAVYEMAKSPGSVTRFAYAFNNGKPMRAVKDEYNATER